jgi:hypothetical protein
MYPFACEEVVKQKYEGVSKKFPDRVDNEIYA